MAAVPKAIRLPTAVASSPSSRPRHATTVVTAVGGRRSDLDGLVAGAAGGALFTGAAQVEQRVVDAHGHADEQDDLEDAVADRGDLADGTDEAERRQDAADGQQHGDAGGDERAEGDEQQRERERQRRGRRLAHVVLEDLVEGLLGRRSAERSRCAGRWGWREEPTCSRPARRRRASARWTVATTGHCASGWRRCRRRRSRRRDAERPATPPEAVRTRGRALLRAVAYRPPCFFGVALPERRTARPG
jgi:hypothetical protein